MYKLRNLYILQGLKKLKLIRKSYRDDGLIAHEKLNNV